MGRTVVRPGVELEVLGPSAFIGSAIFSQKPGGPADSCESRASPLRTLPKRITMRIASRTPKGDARTALSAYVHYRTLSGPPRILARGVIPDPLCAGRLYPR